MLVAFASMMYAVSVLVCGSILWLTGTHVYAGPGDPAVPNDRESPRVVRYRSDHVRDPFMPKSVILKPAGSSVETQDVNRGTVKVIGTMSSIHGRWAMLEFEDGEQLIVVQG